MVVNERMEGEGRTGGGVRRRSWRKSDVAVIGALAPIFIPFFQMRPRISIYGAVRQSVRISVHMSVCYHLSETAENDDFSLFITHKLNL